MHQSYNQQHIQNQIQQKLQHHSRQQSPYEYQSQSPNTMVVLNNKKLTPKPNSPVLTNLNDSNLKESRTTKPLFDDDLLVIERSNRELELRLSSTKLQSESSPNGKSNKNKAIRFTLPSNHKHHRSAVVVDTIHNNNGIGDIIYEEMDDDKISKLSRRPLSDCFSTNDDASSSKNSIPQSFPSISDIPSIAELNGNPQFKSLTAQKLMSGLSFNSVDTLLEVNAAAEARCIKLNESTETIDFGVI